MCQFCLLDDIPWHSSGARIAAAGFTNYKDKKIANYTKGVILATAPQPVEEEARRLGEEWGQI